MTTILPKCASTTSLQQRRHPGTSFSAGPLCPLQVNFPSPRSTRRPSSTLGRPLFTRYHDGRNLLPANQHTHSLRNSVMASLGEELLNIVNRLQDLVFNTIGNDSLDLPQIVRCPTRLPERSPRRVPTLDRRLGARGSLLHLHSSADSLRLL